VYEFSRAIYRALHHQVEPPHPLDVDEARRQVLTSIEHVVERLATDPHHIAAPSRRLFNDIRFCFPLSAQARVWRIVDAGVQRAHREALDRLVRPGGIDGEAPRCRATTRSGTPCRREPLDRSGWCPSHRHLAETDPGPAAAAVLAGTAA
jgi:hypothetical protein